MSKRDHVIKEILDTEQNYVEKGLNMISKRSHCSFFKKNIGTNVIDMEYFRNISRTSLSSHVTDNEGGVGYGCPHTWSWHFFFSLEVDWAKQRKSSIFLILRELRE